MKLIISLSLVLACVSAAPFSYGVGHAGLGLGHAGLGLGLAHGGVGLAHAGYGVGLAHAAVAPAPLATHPLTAGPVVPHPVNYVAPPLPAPYTTAHQAAGVTTLHQPAPVVTKQIHLGQTSFISGYETRIIKPATPHLPISVPTVLRGSIAYNAPIVKEHVEIHNVQNPVLVERRVDVPYDVPVYKENIVHVPTPVHVDAPYNVPYPVAVQGEPIIHRTQAAPVVTYSQHHQNAGLLAPVHAGYAHHGIAAPALLH